MNIVILNWRDIKNPLAGGAEISLFEHAKHWQKNGANILWFSSDFPGAKRKEELNGISIYRYGSIYTVHIWAFIHSIKGMFNNSDIIIDSFHFIPYFSLFYPQKGKKIVGLINEVAGKLWFSNLFRPGAFIGYFMEPFIIKMYKRNMFLTGSESTKDELIKLKIPDKNIHVVNHGVSVVSVKDTIRKEKDPVVVFLGRVSKDKGIEDAFKVFNLVRGEYPHIRFWIIGKEEEEGTAENLKEKYFDLKNSVEYFGFVNETEKYELLKRAWVLIHPSQKEGWGLNVIEAASQGTPTVGTDVEGLRDSIVRNKTGILTPQKDNVAMAHAIGELINDSQQYNSMSEECKKWAKKFTWEKSTQKSWKLIQAYYEKNL